MIKIIIAGSRTITDAKWVHSHLKKILLPSKSIIEYILNGGADGPDYFGYTFGIEHGIPVKDFPAKWDDLTATPCKIKRRSNGKEYNVLAGFNRNEEMACDATHAIIFQDVRTNPKGTNGSNDMIKRAEDHGVKVKVIKYTGRK